MLCPCESRVVLYLVPVQPRKHPDMTENFLTGMYSINSNNRGPQLLIVSVLYL